MDRHLSSRREIGQGPRSFIAPRQGRKSGGGSSTAIPFSQSASQPCVIPYPHKTDPKTVQTLLRHSDVRLTLQFYSHAISDDRMAAAGAMLGAILNNETAQSGLK
jgi:hypothetical protein